MGDWGVNSTAKLPSLCMRECMIAPPITRFAVGLISAFRRSPLPPLCFISRSRGGER